MLSSLSALVAVPFSAPLNLGAITSPAVVISNKGETKLLIVGITLLLTPLILNELSSSSTPTLQLASP